MNYYTAISTVVSNNSQFLLLLTVLYCVLKIVHLEKEVKYLRYDYVCLRDDMLEQNDEEDSTDEDDGDQENEKESKEELKDGDYEPDEDSSSEE